MSKLMKRIIRFSEYLILFYTFFYLNRRVLIKYLIYPPMSFDAQYYLMDILMMVLQLALMVFALSKRELLKKYLQSWKHNWLLIVFLGLAALSLLWTTYPEATIYRLMVIIFTCLTGIYIGIRYNFPQVRRILMVVGALMLTASAIMAIFWPEIGTRTGYNGAWFGIFWHKNQLGIMAAFFNLIYLIESLQNKNRKSFIFIFSFVFYLISLTIVLLSKSATALILLAGMHGLVLIILAWLRWRERMQKKHYVLAALMITAGITVGLLNIDLLLRLLGKSSTLTGRIPMWEHLMNVEFSKHPWLGAGFGAKWNFESFRFELPLAVGWSQEIIFADNGYIDVLLNQGIIGLAFLLVFLGVLGWKFFQFGIREKCLEAFQPILILVFLLVGNIAYSMFFEIETFYWLLIVISIGLISNHSNLTQKS